MPDWSSSPTPPEERGSPWRRREPLAGAWSIGSGRVRNASTCSSSSSQIRDTEILNGAMQGHHDETILREFVADLGVGILPVTAAVAERAARLQAGHARELDCVAELGEVARMLEEGNGAVHQRRASASGGMRGLLRHIQASTLPLVAAAAAA